MDIKTSTTDYCDKKKSYNYSAENLSILDVFVINPLAEKLVSKLPFEVPANIITIISNSFVFLASVIAITARKTEWPIWILIPFCIIIYLIGDAADGIQARRTKTGSPLGEFCDHFLDTFVSAEIMLCIFMAYGERNLTIIAFMLYMSYMTQMSAFWEKYVTHKLHISRFGASETLLILALFATAGFIKPVNAFFSQPAGNLIPFLSNINITLTEIALLLSAAGATISIIGTFIRTKKISFNFFLYMLLSAILSVAAVFVEKDSSFPVPFLRSPFPVVFLTLTFFHVNYSAALLSAITMKEKDPIPDLLLTAAMCVTLFFDVHHPVLYTVYFLYIVVWVAIRVSIFVMRNNKYWYWINPKPSDETKKQEEKTDKS